MDYIQKQMEKKDNIKKNKENDTCKERINKYTRLKGEKEKMGSKKN